MRQKIVVSQKNTLRRVIVLAASAVTVLAVCLIVFINLADNRKAFAAPVLGDYRTTGSGNWNSITTWQRFDGTNWTAATVVPTTADNQVTVLNGHTVTINSNTTVDQVVVEEGGYLIVNDGIILTVANANGTDLDVFGTVKNAGIISQNGGSIVFESTGKYQHNFTITPGTIPSSTWNDGSTCEVIGYTTNPEAPGGLQSFYNFIWNCPQQSDKINLNAGITSVRGDLILMNTGSGELAWANSAINCTIGGNMIVNGGNFVFNKSVSATSLTVGGDYVQSGGSVYVSDGDNSTSTLNITGTCILTGGSANFVKGNSSICTVNLSSDMTVTGGSFATPVIESSSIKFVFRKAGRQYYTASGFSITGNVDYVVNAGAVLDLGTSIVQGRNFTVSAYGGLVIGSADGIMQSGQQGNVQVNGVRAFSTSADYEYASNVAQYTGSGLPSSVRNLTISNANNVTLTRPVAINNVLTFTNGNIITAANEVFVSNASTSAITGYSSSTYVDGNLRRAVGSTGSYDFPVGTNAQYEFISVNLNSVTGISDITSSFTVENPLAASALNGVTVKGVSITNMIPYGYWTLKPDAQLTAGSYSVTATGRGQNSFSNGATFTLLNRRNGSWTSEGIHNSNTQFVNGGAITAVRTSLNVFGDFAIGYGDYLQFQDPAVISGVAGQQNAVYLFPEICSNVDAWIQLSEISSGAALADIDDQTVCYGEAWQPSIFIPANTTSYIKWNVMLKVAGTSVDTVLPQIALTAINVDGQSNVKEFVNAYMPYSYATTPGSTLTISNEDGWYKATSGYNTVNCDTNNHESMFQLNYKNIHNFQLITGVKNITNVKIKKTIPIYFRSFLNGNSGMPVRLMYFTANLDNGEVKLKWATASEDNIDYFTVERSNDAENFTGIKNQRGAGNSNSILYYVENDADPSPGTSFYRLRQTDKNGRYSFSEIQTIINSGGQKATTVDITGIGPNPFTESFTIDFTSVRNQNVNISLVNASGKQVYRSQFYASKGINNFRTPSLNYLNKGVYVVVISDDNGQTNKRVIKN